MEAEGEDQLFVVWGVAPDYFEVVGVPLIEGRGFVEGEDVDGEQRVIINEVLASRYFPGDSAVGRRVRIPDVDGLIVAQTRALTHLQNRPSHKRSHLLSICCTPNRLVSPKHPVRPVR